MKNILLIGIFILVLVLLTSMNKEEEKIQDNKVIDSSLYIVDDEFVSNVLNSTLSYNQISIKYPLVESFEKNFYSFQDEAIDKVEVYGDEINEFYYWNIESDKHILMSASINQKEFVVNSDVFIGMSKDSFKEYFNIQDEYTFYEVGTVEKSWVFEFYFKDGTLFQIKYLDYFTH
ncbi:hypothetical protein H6790_00185 [Candidatus Nomurabacteria bacterium]|nr:hypothetical protein [Candidatus Nomurabacteria bacterium]MCB9820355.1 hypothetical protein [Candidatus Nomurabacteria bacterium]